MRSIAVNVAVVGVFVLAFVSWASGLTPFVCAQRAAEGALALYVLVRVATGLIERVLASAPAASTGPQPADPSAASRKHARDHRNA